MRLKHYVSQDFLTGNSVRILLVGCGGTGSHVVSGLARMNSALRALGHGGIDLTVVDGDTVSESNVGRQLFSPADIGLNKADVLVQRVNCFFGLDWASIPHRISSGRFTNSCFHYNMVIAAVDTVESRQMIENNARRIQCEYYLDLGNTKDTGQVILGTVDSVRQPKGMRGANHLPTVFELFPDLEKLAKETDQGPSCSVREALLRQDLFINQIVADCGVSLIWKMFRSTPIHEHGCFITLKPAIGISALPIDPDVWTRMGVRLRESDSRKAA